MSAAFDTDPYWYKDAVIYQVHVKSFFDSNDDGIGDFAGLLAKLDYIVELGVTAVWLLPFYPSPRRDDGYDIAEYRDVSPDYGTFDDIKRFVEEAHRRGLRVITELVINHTSDQHPWFQAARKAPPGSPERDFYVWSDTDTLYSGTRIIFLDTEKSNWTWDEEAQAFYWHRFYSHQPDLNFDNPKVLEEVLSIMHFWLDTGIDGLRLDAIPYLIERDGTSNENLSETHEILKKIRADLDAHYPDRMLLAEANMWPEDTQQYFGPSGEECHMAFHFPLMPRMYMAVAQEDRFPITDIMRQTPDIPEQSQWAIFLRNHDELTLEMVTDAERDYLWNTYAADRRARINLGIRRRLSPLMERDRRRVELMNALLLTMPGTPIMYYGDEIGMGDNIHLGDRDGVRTPMQWSPDRNGGFSRGDPERMTLPPIQDPLYGFQTVNAESQIRDRHSLLNWVRRMLAVRREHQAFGRGTQRFLRPANRKILAYLREFDGESILCVANLGRSAQAVELDLGEFAGRIPVELTDSTVFPQIGQLPYLLTLPPYGFYWFKLSDQEQGPEWSSAAPHQDVEHHTFVLRAGLPDLFEGNNRRVLENDILPGYISRRRWYGGKHTAIGTVALTTPVPMPDSTEVLMSIAEIDTEAGRSRYALPLGVAWEGDVSGPFAPNLALSRVRRGRYVGLLTDGFAVPEFVRSVLTGLRDNAVVETGAGTIAWRSVEDIGAELPIEPEWIAAEQSNSTVIVAQRVVIKLLRRLQPGIHPEVEMTRHLRELGFESVPPLHGEAVFTDAEGHAHTLMLVQGFVWNQGDGWQWTLDLIGRSALDSTGSVADFANYETFAETLGRRLAQMHALLMQPSSTPEFAPETIGRDEAAALERRVLGQIDAAFAALDRSVQSEGGAEIADQLRSVRPDLEARVRRLAATAEGKRRSRIHGDLHLGQVLVTGSDVMIIDFEGEPTRSLDERRAKDHPMRDVAGVLRSFDYAAAVAGRTPTSAPDSIGQDTIYDQFRQISTTAFLAGYGEESGGKVPELLDLFLIEKAAYEIAYEAANRPDWIDVPAAGLLRLARADSTEGAA